MKWKCYLSFEYVISNSNWFMQLLLLKLYHFEILIITHLLTYAMNGKHILLIDQDKQICAFFKFNSLHCRMLNVIATTIYTKYRLAQITMKTSFCFYLNYDVNIYFSNILSFVEMLNNKQLGWTKAYGC